MFFLKRFYWKHKRYIPLFLVISTFIFGYATYVVLTSSDNSLNSKSLFLLLYIDILLLSLVSFSIIDQIKRAFKLRNKKEQGNRFHKQIIMLFSGVTIIPAACVFVFAVIFFNIGIEHLFGAPVNNAMSDANQVASIYIDEMRESAERFATGFSERIKECIDGSFINSEKIEKVLREESPNPKIDMVVKQANGYVIAKSPFSISLQFEKIPSEDLYYGGSWETASSVVALSVVDQNLGVYLLVSSAIDKRILDHKHKIKKAVMEYTELATQRSGLKVTFMAFFSVVTILLLMAAVLVGFIFANWLLRPINKLIIAARSVSQGNYNTTIKADKFKNEWDILISSFNIMISKLEQQRQQLIISNTQNAWRDIARKIAHEIKNPLTPIQLSAERLKRKYQKEITSSPEIFNTCIDTIIRQVDCIGTLVKEFSDFARMPAPKMEKTDIIKLLNETIFIQSNAHKNIAFRRSFERDDFSCNVDPAQLNQVLMNVFQNSINAIVENNKPGARGFIGNISVNFSVNAKAFCITIDDDGPGFSEESAHKALEPYYTTREAGNGLGLAIVYKIITEHGGKIKLGKSTGLGGASIVIEIPHVY